MRDISDPNDPHSVLEASDERNDDARETAVMFGRILAWLLDAKTLSHIGFRAMILAYKMRPDLIGGRTLDQIGRILGHGRSSAHKLSKELEDTFGLRGINDKSDRARQIYSAVWRRNHNRLHQPKPKVI